jgi:hypothetical protein
MDDLKLALREYVDQTIERIDADAVARAGADSEERRSWRRPVTAVVVAAVAVVTVVVATVVAIEAIRQDPVVPTSPSTSTTTAATTTTIESLTTTSTTVIAAPVIEWTSASVEDAENAAIAGVAAGDGLFVAVGERVAVASQDEYPSDAAVWVSTDGATWEAIDDPSFKGVAGDDTDGIGMFDRTQGMIDVAIGPLGVIAVGIDEASGAIWTSPDGRSWTQVRDGRLSAGPYALWRVIAGGPGWVAVGEDGQGNGWVWLSDDGIDWSIITDDTFSFDRYGAPVALWDVVAHGDQLVAVGTIGYLDTLSLRNAVWVSDDGIDWELAADDGGPAGVSRDDSRGMLVGFADTPLLSIDASRWTAGATPAPPPSAEVVFRDMWALAAGRDYAASVWVSLDGGVTWTKSNPTIPGFSDDSLTQDVAPTTDGGVVVVGTLPGVLAKAAWGEAIGSTAEIWIARMSDR